MSEVLSLENLIVGALLLAAVVSDLKFKKVKNQTVLAMLLISVVSQLLLHGPSSSFVILSSIATAFIICLPLYLMKIFGGGDFKVLLAVSPLLVWKAVLIIVAASFVWGALLGLIRAIISGQAKNLFQNLIGIISKNNPQPSQLHMIPFTVAFFFGFLSYLSLSRAGLELL